MVVELREDGNVDVGDRVDAVRPADAKRSDVRRILKSAATHFEQLLELWEKMHG